LEAAVAAEERGEGLSPRSGPRAEADSASSKPTSETQAKGAAHEKATSKAKGAVEPKGAVDKPDKRASEKSATAAAKAASAPFTWGAGFTAFVYAAIITAVAIASGFGASAAARAMVEGGGTLPVLGRQTALVLPLVVLVLSAVPNLLVYRANAMGKAMVASLVAVVVGEVLWGLGNQYLADHVTQLTLFGAGGMLLGLLLLGLRGGARARKSAPKRAPPT
jgi:hypothetical protein